MMRYVIQLLFGTIAAIVGALLAAFVVDTSFGKTGGFLCIVSAGIIAGIFTVIAVRKQWQANEAQSERLASETQPLRATPNVNSCGTQTTSPSDSNNS